MDDFLGMGRRLAAECRVVGPEADAVARLLADLLKRNAALQQQATRAIGNLAAAREGLSRLRASVARLAEAMGLDHPEPDSGEGWNRVVADCMTLHETGRGT